jgi:hypothetical protein
VVDHDNPLQQHVELEVLAVHPQDTVLMTISDATGLALKRASASKLWVFTVGR